MKKAKSNPDPGPLRVLILEDNPADAELVDRELRRAGITFSSRLVEGKREYSKALADFQPQVILSDFKLPRFDGLAALEITRLRAPDTPFIFVSGSIGEEKAIKTLAQGASDYILKDNLARLGPAIKRVVEAAHLKLEKKKTDEELRRHVDELRLLAEAADRFVQINDLNEVYDYLAQTIRDISRADYLILSLYDEQLQGMRPKIITGFEPFRETIRRRFHFDPGHMVFYLKDMRQDDFSDFVSRRLLPVRDGLYGLVNRKIARPECSTIEKLLDIGSMHTMGFSWENQLYGSMTVLFKKGNELKNHAQIETLLNQAAVSIKRLLAEKSLRNNEERLRQSEEYYRTLVETSPDAIILVDAGGRVTFASQKTLEIFGIPAQTSIIGSSILDFVEPKEIPRVQERMVEILSGRSLPQINEYRLLKQDRRPFWGEISSSPLRDAVGRNVGLLLVLRDVSERKQAETIQQIQYTIANAVATAETFFSLFETVRKELSALLDTTNFLIALYDEASGMLSAPFEKDEKDTIPQWPAEKSLTGLVIKQKRSLLLNKEQIQQMFQTGTIEWIRSRAETWLGVPLLINEKMLGAIVVQSYDKLDAYDQNSIAVLEIIASQLSVYMERKRAESQREAALEELRQSEVQLQVILESTADGILAIDNKGKIIKTNKRFVELWRIPQDILATGDDNTLLNYVLSQLINPEEFLAKVRLLYQSTAEDADTLTFKDGRIFERFSAPLFLSAVSIGRVWSFRDVTERKKAEEQIRASLKEKVVLLQEIHHRVKNNLQIISGLLTMQADQSAGKSLGEIFHASQDRIRSIALIHEKLYGSHNLAEIAFDEYLRALTENLFTSHGVAAGRITAKYEMESVLFTIEKAIPLGLIVNELVTNALKHAFPNGRQGEIRIELHGYKGAKSYALKTDSGTLHCVPTCELIIADDGVGLPAGQVPEQQKTLGMNLVSMLARQLHAELKVKTGPGAEFRLLFPGLPANEYVKDKDHGG